MISRIKSIAEGAKQKILTGVYHPTGAVGVVISQTVQVGVVRIASRGEEEINVIIALLVVTRGHVARECYCDQKRGSRQGNSRQLFRQDTE